MFLGKVAKYFECKFAFSARTPQGYGEKVFNDLVPISRCFLAEPAERSKWIALVRAVAKVMDAQVTL